MNLYFVKLTDGTFTEYGMERISGHSVWADNEEEAIDKAVKIAIKCQTGTIFVSIEKTPIIDV